MQRRIDDIRAMKRERDGEFDRCRDGIDNVMAKSTIGQICVVLGMIENLPWTRMDVWRLPDTEARRVIDWVALESASIFDEFPTITIESRDIIREARKRLERNYSRAERLRSVLSRLADVMDKELDDLHQRCLHYHRRNRAPDEEEWHIIFRCLRTLVNAALLLRMEATGRQEPNGLFEEVKDHVGALLHNANGAQEGTEA